MAFFYNPRGITNREFSLNENLPANTRYIFGTEGDDVFTFDGPFEGGAPVVVVGLGGNDTMNSALNRTHGRYYEDYFRAKEWKQFFDTDEDPPFELGGVGHIHVGELDRVNPGLGEIEINSRGRAVPTGDKIDRITTHGGSYEEPAVIRVQWSEYAKTRVYIPGEEDVIRFETGVTRRDFDGEGWTSEVVKVLVENDTPNNRFTDGQLVSLEPINSGHYAVDGRDYFRREWIDHDRRSGPTNAEEQLYVDNWEVIA